MASQIKYVPTEYHHIKLGQWCAWHEAGDNEILKCAAATGMQKEEVRLLKRDQLDKAIALFQKALNNPTSTIKQTFTHNGVEYGLIPDMTSGGMTAGEHIDLVNNSNNETMYKTLPKVMAILYRPVIAKSGKRYEIEPYDWKRINDQVFKDLPMDIVSGALLFFSTISKELQVNSQLSLAKKLQKMTTELSSQPTNSPSTDGNTFLSKFRTVFFRRKKK
jgi:hypothetical protein